MTEIDLLHQAFAGAQPPIGDLAGLTSALNRWYLQHPDCNFLHPCQIGGRPALVCQADLSRNEPAAFAELQAIAERYALYLKEDARRREQTWADANRRRGIGLVLSFCIGLSAVSRSVGADELLPVNVVAGQHLPSPLGASANTGDGVIRLRHRHPPSAAQVLAAYSQKQTNVQVDSAAAADIAEFLQSLYQKKSGDPPTVNADLQTIADYFSRYPQAVALIGELRGQKIGLDYQAGAWQTVAFGNQFGISSVTIRFDTRLGAQLLGDPGCDATPACSIAPADALLHELLHAKLMLLDSEHFIAGGGLAPGLYPFEHEHEVIAEENRLFQAMNQTDGRARPIRHRHSGELLQVSCPACIPVKQVASGELSL
ncbi:hypothetical protein PL263_03475 [Methylomonas sp. EFPC3]|uniref:hypothetical protein n=1 Tax=Methylomonas sp. EFPC3 TaxID=3021710 RepID=UPI00241634FE|nr:hypothetical protein [Methylomonas sp. EFPC3]WFP51091.1 hypothetical protein PL263_03475 [Methylomonas sp. EFPC3]